MPERRRQEERFAASVVRISDVTGRLVGGGFWVAADLICTAAHVVAMDGPFTVTFPTVPGHPSVAATVALSRVDADVAGLRLTDPAPEAAVVIRLVAAEDVWGHECRMLGFPAGHDAGVWAIGTLRGPQASGWIQLDDDRGAGFAAGQGFSGVPVWDDRLRAAIGMIVATEADAGRRTAYAVPTRALLAAWPELADAVRSDNPYRGLQPFREEDAPYFFGQADAAAALADRVQREPFTVLVGPSGSGKSSLLAAGVLPILRQRRSSVMTLRTSAGMSAEAGFARRLSSWLAEDAPAADAGQSHVDIVHRVGDAVAAGLDSAGTDRLVVVVDQFEELVGHDPAQAAALVALLRMAIAANPRVRVVVTLRSDLLDRASGAAGLAPELRDSMFFVAPLSGERLRQVIVEPLTATGTYLEAGVAERILADAAAAPGALPVVEFLLTELWEQQVGGGLTHEAYEAVGGVAGVVSRYAERVLATDVPEADLLAVRSLMLQLVQLTPDGVALRRTARTPEMRPAVLEVARRLAGSRLVVTGTDGTGVTTYDIAHEALIREWPRLRAWIEEAARFRVWQDDLRENMSRGEPLRGPRVREAVGWLNANPDDLTVAEQEFIAASRRRQRRSTAAWRTGAGVIVLLLVVSTTLAVLFERGQARVTGQLRDVAATSLAATSADNRASDLNASVLAALTAYRTTPNMQARSNLLDTYLRLRQVRQLLPDTREVTDMAVVALPPALLTAGARGLLRWPMDGAGRSTPTILSPHADLVASGAGGAVAFAADRDVSVLERDGRIRKLGTADHDIASLQFDPSGRWLLELDFEGKQGGGYLAVRWDRSTGVADRLQVGSVLHAWFGADAQHLVTMALDFTTSETWDLGSGTHVRHEPGAVIGVDPHGSTMIVCSEDPKKLTLREVTTGRILKDFGLRCDETASAIFDPGGQVAAYEPSISGLATEQIVHLLDLGTGRVAAVALPPFSGTGIRAPRPAPVAAADGWLIAVATSGGLAVASVTPDAFTDVTRHVFGDPAITYDARVDDTASTAVTVEGDERPLSDDHFRTLRTWQLPSGRSLSQVRLPTDSKGGPKVLTITPEVVAVLLVDPLRVELRDPRDLATVRHTLSVPLSPAVTDPGKSRQACARVEGQRLAVFNGSTIYEWNYPSLDPLDQPLDITDGHPERLGYTIIPCMLSPARRLYAFGTLAGKAEVWNGTNRSRLITASTPAGVANTDVMLENGGTRLAVLTDNGEVQVWDTGHGDRASLQTFRVATVNSADLLRAGIRAFDHGTIIVQAGLSVSWWDAASSRRLMAATITTANASDFDVSVAVTADGSSLLVNTNESRLQRASLRTDTWRNTLCAMLGRDLRMDERRALPPGTLTDHICP